MKYAKKVILVGLTMMILMASAATAYASIQWSYLTTIAADMIIDDNGIANVDIMCDGDARDIDKITAKCELQQYDGGWHTIKTWSETENDSIVRYEKSYAVAKNYSYRIKVTASVYKGSKLLEEVTECYSEQFYR